MLFDSLSCFPAKQRVASRLTSVATPIRLRQLGTREFRDPSLFLRRIKALESSLAHVPLDREVRQLRTNRLKEWRETRVAALFCYGMGQRLGHTVYVSRGEVDDADFIASWVEDDVQQLAPVQLKEIVPDERNGRSDLDQVIESLHKYSDAEDLNVVLHLNRQLRFDPLAVRLPYLRISSLWILGCTSLDGTEWGLWGDFLTQNVEEHRFAYPGGANKCDAG
jgi:hypothetical protein